MGKTKEKNYFGAMRKWQIESQKLMVENTNLKTQIRMINCVINDPKEMEKWKENK